MREIKCCVCNTVLAKIEKGQVRKIDIRCAKCSSDFENVEQNQTAHTSTRDIDFECFVRSMLGMK